MKAIGECFVTEGQLLGQSHTVCKVLRKGSYANLAKCSNNETGKLEVVKIIENKPVTYSRARKEIAIMTQLRCLDPDTCNIVRWNGFFFHEKKLCLKFELLDQSLAEYMDSKRLAMTEIKAVIHQMATALLHLGSIGIIHADVEPTNIMVVDRNQPALKVKLIDFSLAHPVSEATYNQNVQSTGYRAPEATLGVPYSRAMDIWSLGVVAAELATGLPLYKVERNYDVLSFITETQGQQPGNMVDCGLRADFYFKKESNYMQHWTLETPEEFPDKESHSECEMLLTINSLGNIEDLMAIDKEDDGVRRLLEDLIKNMLHLDPDQRIKPQEILQHPFIASSPNSYHANSAIKMINTDVEERTVDSRSSSSFVAVPSENIHCENRPKHKYYGTLIGQCHKVLRTLGQGSYGSVMKCVNTDTGKIEAIKVFKRDANSVSDARKEIGIMRQLQCLPDTCNIVKWNGFFFHETDVCLKYELLDQSLWAYRLTKNRRAFSMALIRTIIHELATALEHLRSIQVIHADIKLDNVMIVDRNQYPMKVKLIDFGLAHASCDIIPGKHVQVLWYRAPELMLEIPYDEAIDMWGLGILAAEMAVGSPLYPGNTENEMLSMIIQLQGQPPDHVLERGRLANIYFKKESDRQGWRFMAPAKSCCNKITCLDDLRKFMVEDKQHERDQFLLVDLIERMLALDPVQRIKPWEVLQHPFISSLPNSHYPNTVRQIISSEDKGIEISQQASSCQTSGEEDSFCSCHSTLTSI